MAQPYLINVAFAEDHNCVRQAISSFIEQEDPAIKISVQAGNGMELLDQLAKRDTEINICLLDIQMPVMNGYDTLRELKRRWPGIKVIALSLFDLEYNIVRMMQGGASLYLPKDTDAIEIVKAIRSIHERGHYYCDLLSPRVKELVYSSRKELPMLHGKEKQFLTLLVEGHGYKEIALRMSLSQRTVEGYRDSLFEKFGLHEKTALVSMALRTGLVTVTH